MSGTAPSRHQLVVPLAAAGDRLDLFLAAAVAGVSRKAVKKALDAGQVFIDGRVERRAGLLLAGGETVQVTLTAAAVASTPPVPELEVLYRDEHLLAIAKPAGWPVHRTVAGGPNIHDAVTARFGGASPPILLHRLDADTTGVLLFALDATANADLSRQFSGRTVRKTYLALVAGNPPASFSVHDHLRSGVRGRTVRVASGGLPAETVFSTLACGDGFSLVRAEPKTGRTHQIRAHLAAEGYPLLGDRLYGGAACVALADGRKLVAGRYLLHAREIEFTHPTQARRCSLQAPLPADFLPFLAVLGVRSDIP